MSSVNALAVLDQGRLPSVYRGRSSSLNSAAQANIGLGFAIVTYRGKVWRLVYQGEEDIVRDPARPDQPASTIEVVIIGAATAVSKQYYAKPYVEGSDQAPDCYSLDGIKPEANAPQKQSVLCGNCPQNEWGSRITDGGKRAKRCADSKRLAIVPALDLENETYGGPMLLRVPPTSLANLSLYAGNLARRTAPLEGLVTRIGFNHEVAYPQLTFTPVRWLTDEEARLVVGPDGVSGVMAHPVVSRILVDSVAMPAVGANDPGGAEEPEGEPQPEASPPSTEPAPPPPPPAEPAPPPAAAAPEPAPQASSTVTPLRRSASAAFGGAAAAPAPAAPATAPESPAPNGAATPVSAAPAGLNAAIDKLLTTQIA